MVPLHQQLLMQVPSGSRPGPPSQSGMVPFQGYVTASYLHMFESYIQYRAIVDVDSSPSFLGLLGKVLGFSG